MRRPRLTCTGAPAALLLLTLLRPAAAQAGNAELAHARQLYSEMQYEKADQAYRAALEASGNRPADLADIYLHLGIIAASTNRKTAAVDNFVRLLCIEPQPSIGEELPPKVQRRLDEARAKAGKITRFAVSVEPLRTLPRAGGLQLTVALTPDSLGLAKGLALRYRVAGATRYQIEQRPLASSVSFALTPAQVPPGKDVEYMLQLTDQYGGALYEVGNELTPLRAQTPVPPTVGQATGGPSRAAAAANSGSWLTQPWFYIATGAGIVALLAGGATAAAVTWVATEPKQAHFGQVGQEIGQAP